MEDVSMMMVDSPAISRPQTHTFLSTRIAQVTDQISFTPTAAAKRSVPRAWERVPSTAFLARHKSRKIWKRFRKSMELLRERTRPAAVSRIEEKEFEREINASANADYRRVVKRQRLDGGPNYDENTQTERGRSFLETKWEFEIGKRCRKLVALTQQQQQDGEQSFDSEDAPRLVDELLEESTRLTSPETESYAAADVLGQGSAEAICDLDSSQAFGDAVNPTIEIASSEAAAEIVEIVARQEPNLVRSALRMNSLDGEDAALLSEFLSRAQAKRAANAAMIPTKKAEETVSVNSPTVRSRRALEELDKNSPSPQKTQQVSTPTKGVDNKAVESPTPKALPEVNDEDATREGSSPSKCRRSARAKLPKAPPQAHSQRPAVPNQIPVRRANGTEFVFLQRTEAQELALVTKKNTRRNKGNSVLPKQFLQTCKQGQSEDESSEDSASKGRARAGSKQVCWKDEELVEYAPERQFEALELQSPERKVGRPRIHALPATPSKKVRRINMAGPAPAPASSNNPIVKPLSVGTPIPKRKKLTPKTPSADSTVSTKSAEPAVTKGSSVPKPVSQKASGIPKSKNSLKAPASITSAAAAASSAGATPVAKRLRAKKIQA